MAAIDEKFFLNWNEHSNNFSLVFNELLQGDELVDVKLVAEGHLVSAHRMVLSAMSPYFRNMFTQMPVNQQAFVFLKDISKQTVTDLIIYIYCGEVNVKPERLEEFMNAAQALNIKGLTGSNGTQSFDSRSSASTAIKPTFSGSLYQTPNFSHSFGSAGVQYQSVQCSAKSTPYQQPLNEYQAKVNFNFGDKDQMNGGFDQESFKYDQYYREGSSSNNNKPMKGINDPLFDQWNSEFEIGSNNDDVQMIAMAPKRSKINIDKSEYDIVADIRNNWGHEQLFHNQYVFNKHRKPTMKDQQRWRCQKENQKCHAAASTLNINGVIMMKVLCAEHNHEPMSTD